MDPLSTTQSGWISTAMAPAAVVRAFLAELRMPPETFVCIARWMGAQAARYEACCTDDEEMDSKPV